MRTDGCRPESLVPWTGLDQRLTQIMVGCPSPTICEASALRAQQLIRDADEVRRQLRRVVRTKLVDALPRLAELTLPGGNQLLFAIGSKRWYRRQTPRNSCFT